MSERLVVDKGPRQRRIEGWLYLILPPVIGAACWLELGRGLWQVLAIVGAFIILSTAGNAIAVRLGGEFVTPTERWRRNMERIAAQSSLSLLSWLFFFYLSLFVGFNVPMMRLPPSRQEALLMFGIMFGGAAICSVLCAFFLRQRIAATRLDQLPTSPESPWPWLVRTAPSRLISPAAVAIGYLVATRFSGIAAQLVFLAAAVIGLIAQSTVDSRFVKSGPVLWVNLSFAAAFAAGASVYGLYFAALIGCTQLLMLDAPERTPLMISLFAAGGFLGGVLFALVQWALARLNAVKAKG